MACEECGRTDGTALERAFSGTATLGLGLSAAPDAGPLARRAEEAGFSALWLPPSALAAAAAATTSIVLVAVVDVSLSPDASPSLPTAEGADGRLAYAVRFTDPPDDVRLSARACRRAGATVMRRVHAVAGKTDASVVIQGSCHESLEWIAEQADAWAYDRARLACVPTLLTEWRRVAGRKPFVQVIADGPGLEDRVAALLRDGVNHVAVTLAGREGAGDGTAAQGSPSLWRLPRTVAGLLL